MIIELFIKNILDKLVQEKFDEIQELTYETDHDDLIYYFKGNTARENFDDFDNGIELLRKIQSSEVKLKDVKELQNIFTSNLNEIPKVRFKWKLEIIKLLYQSRQTVIKLFNDYSSIATAAKRKAKKGKRIKNVKSQRNASKITNFACVLAQAKAGNTSENLQTEIRQIKYSLYRRKEATKKVYNNIMNSVMFWNTIHI